jgi:transcriptional regulator with XRE-family HTH domain
MTPAQCRAARALIDMSQAELAGRAVVPTSLIADYETGANVPRQADLDAIQAALERAGVEFIGGDRPGVRFRKAQ